MRKVVLSILFLFVATSFAAFAQETAEQRATKKADVLAKFIDVKFTAEPTKKLNATQKKNLKTAYTEWEVGKDSLKVRQEKLKKTAADYKTKYDGQTLTEEQMAAQKAEQEAIKTEQEAIKAVPAALEEKFDTNAKAALNADQKKIFEEFRAAQKAKKGN